jgi:hypothetical protein
VSEAVDRVLGAAKATYNFFTGDAIVLGLVAVAFVVAAAIAHLAPGAQLAAGVVFVALILLGITLTLGREREAARRGRTRA